MSKKIIVVAGATGAQGGGLARAIVQDRTGEFAVRALTRKTHSEKARELAKLGAEVVEANFDRGRLKGVGSRCWTPKKLR